MNIIRLPAPVDPSEYFVTCRLGFGWGNAPTRVGASALLFGSIGGDSGPDAARLGIHVPQPHSDYLFNGCVIGGINCANTPAASSGVPAAITKAEILSSFPRDEMFAIKLLLTGWAEQDPDATLAQLLDRAGKCVALLKVSPTTSWQSCP